MKLGLQRLLKKQNIEKLNQVLMVLQQLREKSDFVVFVPGTTGYNWMGVNSATFALFPDQTIELPHYYSSTIFSEKEIEILVLKIQDLAFSQIIFSGFPPYFGELMKRLKNKTTKIGLIYHGFFSELSGNQQLMQQLKWIVELNKSGFLDKIAFNKKGMAESLKALWGIEAHKIILKTPLLSSVTKQNDGVHIGVLGNDQFRKNLHNQVVAAAMIKDVHIHVTTDTNFEYLPAPTIIKHPTGQSHSDFTQILGSMDVNLHLSFSESWGQLTTESLAMGVPCLTAYHSDVFDYDEELREMLVVSDFDDSFGIAKKLNKILQLNGLSEKCKNYIIHLNSLSNETINRFLKY
jgi:glycosyltransferase involved in cell wall biosynthesis